MLLIHALHGTIFVQKGASIYWYRHSISAGILVKLVTYGRPLFANTHAGVLTQLCLTYSHGSMQLLLR